MITENRPQVLLVNKPKGPTSFDIIRSLKKLINQKKLKIGHLGTLDPFASGLLVIGIHGGTKINDHFHDLYPKTYIATGIVGIKTDSADSTGNITHQDPKMQAPSINDLQKIADSMLGEYWQTPPHFSATKFEGKALYEWAREGVLIEKEKVKRNLIDFKILKVENNHIVFEATVSSGTYIRTLFEDLLIPFNLFGHLVDLERVKIGDIKLEMADVIDHNMRTYSVDQILVLPEVILEEKDTQKYKNGMSFNVGIPDVEKVWVKDQNRKLLGLAKIVDHNIQVIFNLPQ